MTIIVHLTTQIKKSMKMFVTKGLMNLSPHPSGVGRKPSATLRSVAATAARYLTRRPSAGVGRAPLRPKQVLVRRI